MSTTTSPTRDIPSPCVGVCELHPENGLCLGCLRTMDEIAAWRDISAAERYGILKRIAERRRLGHRTVKRNR
ncbi:MAG: DUF1289 domain-containing protein [Rhodospirillales bacterium]|nr:MAG: DUF1289 domain-containing protein [Rhodospirillales bacterium]